MSQITAVAVPKWGLEMTEGTLVAWMKSIGDEIAVGDEVFEMESDKATNTWQAPEPGILRRTMMEPGEIRQVGALIGVIAAADVDDADIDAYIAEHASSAPAAPDPEPVAAAPAPVAVATSAPLGAPAAVPGGPVATGTSVPESLRSDADDKGVYASSRARRRAAELGVNLTLVTGTGRLDRVSVDDVHSAIVAAGGRVEAPVVARAAPGPRRSTADDSGVSATPVARRIAADLGVNLNDARPTGRHGRVMKVDVEAAHARMNGGVVATATGHTAMSAAPPPEVESVPMSGMRRTIASRLQASKQQAPHFRISVDVCMDPLLAMRSEINANEPGVKLSVNDLVIKAAAAALVRSPNVNAQYDAESGTIHRFRDADIAMAVTVDSGLITPIIRAANKKSLGEISADARDLITRAKAGTLSPSDYQGGSFTISNLGMYKIPRFDAIINPPQVAILGVGAAEPRPVVSDGEITIKTMATITIIGDHRVLDGEPAAQFVRLVQDLLEQPARLLA